MCSCGKKTTQLAKHRAFATMTQLGSVPVLHSKAQLHRYRVRAALDYAQVQGIKELNARLHQRKHGMSGMKHWMRCSIGCAIECVEAWDVFKALLDVLKHRMC